MSELSIFVSGLPERPDWQQDGLCHQEVDLFFGKNSIRERKYERIAREEAAKAVCRLCPVQIECAQYAIDKKIEHGVWGGMTEQERRNVHKIS